MRNPRRTMGCDGVCSGARNMCKPAPIPERNVETPLLACQWETRIPTGYSYMASSIQTPEGLPCSPVPSRCWDRFWGAATAIAPPRRSPAHPTAGRTRHAAAGAAEARGSPPAQPGRRADLDGAQQRAACQAAPAPPAQPAPLRTGTSPHAALQAQGTKPAVPGCWMGTRWDPCRLPFCPQPWAGQFPTPTSRRCCRK